MSGRGGGERARHLVDLYAAAVDGIDDALSVLRHTSRKMIFRAVSRERRRHSLFAHFARDKSNPDHDGCYTAAFGGTRHRYRRYTAMDCLAALSRSCLRVVLIAALIEVIAVVAVAWLRRRPLPIGPAMIWEYVDTNLRTLPQIGWSEITGTLGTNYPLWVASVLAVLLPFIALAQALGHVWDLLLALVLAAAMTVAYAVLFAVAILLATPVIAGLLAIRLLADVSHVHTWGDARRQVTRMPQSLAAVAAALLPGAHRDRYAEEFASELHDLAEGGTGWWRQLAYSMRLLVRAGLLFWEVKGLFRRSKAPS